MDLSPWPTGLEVVVRQDEKSQHVFAINSGSDAVLIGCSGIDLLTGRRWAEEDKLDAGQVAVVTRPINEQAAAV